MGVVIPNLLTEDRVSGAQIVDGGLRFNTNFYLSRTPGSAGNRRTWTWSGWVKRSAVGTKQQIFGVTGVADADYCENYFGTDNKLYLRYGYTSVGEVVTTQVFRDVSSWYHILFAFDVTQSTASNKLKLYINGVEVTSFSTDTRSSLTNTDWAINRTGAHYLSTAPNGAGTEGLSALLSNVYFIDGQALGPGYFGYTDPLTNTWRPKKTNLILGSRWSNYWSGSVLADYPTTYSFDGNTGTRTRTGGGTLTWTPPFSIPFTTLRLNAGRDGSPTGEIYVNGTNVSSQFGANPSWVTVTGVSSPLTSIALKEISSQYPGLAAVEIDGTILTDTANAVDPGTNGFYLPLDGNTPIGQDQSGRGNNWTPVNFGGSNTLEKATGALPILNTDGGGKVARVGVRTDSNASSLVLALPLVGIKDDISNRINSGSTAKTITANGDTAASSAQSNFYGGSFAFDGTGDYLSIPDNADFAFGSGDFTIESWVYINNLSSTRTISGQNNSGGGGSSYGHFLEILSDGSVNAGGFEPGVNYINVTTPTGRVTTGKWHHIAMVRNGNNLILYVDGINQASLDITGKSFTDSSNLFAIGRPGEYNGYYMNGYIQDYRLYKGVAKYTQNFIPASTDPDILPDTPSGVAYSSNVALVPSTDGAVAFDGSGDYLQLAYNADLNFGSGDFTIEGFISINTLGTKKIIANYIAATATTGNDLGWIFGVNASNQLEGVLYNGTSAVGLIQASTLTTGKWYHVAYVRSGTNFYMFIDGTLVGTATGSGAHNVNTGWNISIGYGHSSDTQYMNGFISNLQIVKGTALYTSNFTPPTAPITSVANTKLLCCKSQVYQNVGDVGITTSWSNYTSCPAGFYSGNPVYNMFDGSTSTSAQSGGTVGDNGIITFTPPSPIVYSNTLRVYTDNGNYNLNGTGWSGTMGAGWYTITSSGGGTLTSLAFRWYNQPAGGYVNVMAIEVDGTILTDGIITKGNTAATNFNPFTANINAVRGQESGYATLNPLDNQGNTLSNGNLVASQTTSSWYSTKSNISVSSGKWYYEATVLVNSGGNYQFFGVYKSDVALPAVGANGYIGYSASGWAVQTDGRVWNNASSTTPLGTASVGDTLMIAFDVDNSKIWFGLNGIWYGSPATGSEASFTNLTSPLSPAISLYATQTCSLNFGQKPFKFPPPAGFQPLALANTPRPTIVRPDQYVGIITWVGDGTTTNNGIRSFSGLNFGSVPDLVWVKNRTGGFYHVLTDTVRGAGGNKSLSTNDVTIAEGQFGSGNLQSFDYNGFTMIKGSDATASDAIRNYNTNGSNYVAWCWKAGGNKNTFNINDVGYATASAAGLTAGTITPTGASVNTKSGFSIIKYTGTGANATISHGLGNAPSFIIIKKRTSSPGATNWRVYHSALGNTKAIFLSTDGTSDTNSVYWNNTSPSSSVFSLGSDDGLNASSQTHIAYLWAEIPGFSKFGSVTLSASANDSFIWTGFRPRWFLIKGTGSTSNWIILDSTRDPFNFVDNELFANLSNAENAATSTYSFDFLSNGIKCRNQGLTGSFIYAAFAEAPSFNLYGGQANAR